MADYKCLDEDQVAHGVRLAFPNIQTCVAAIAVLPTSLLGYHFTLGSLQRLADARSGTSGWSDTQRARATWWIDRAGDYVGGDRITGLYFVGNTPGYNLRDLKAVFVTDLNGGTDIPTYSYNIYRWEEIGHSPIRSQSGVTVFAIHAGPTTAPQITYKRQSKVTVSNKHGRDVTVGPRLAGLGIGLGKLANLNFDQDATIDCEHVHQLRRDFATI